SIDIENIIGGAAADIDDERAQIFLVLCEHDLRGSKRAEDHVLNVERQFFDAPNRVLDACAHAVDDVKVGFQFLPEHSDRAEHAVLSIDVVVLDDRMEKSVGRGNAHFTRADLHVLDVLIVDLIAIFRQKDASAVVKALN